MRLVFEIAAVSTKVNLAANSWIVIRPNNAMHLEDVVFAKSAEPSTIENAVVSKMEAK